MSDASSDTQTGPASRLEGGAALEHCQALVRRDDPDRYFASLFIDDASRPCVLALYAFNSEVARIRESVSEVLPGEIRLQWWRDALKGAAQGDADANPVAAALTETIRRHHLPLQPFLDLIEARTFDLYDDPIPTLSDLEGYAGETASSLFRMAAIVAGSDASAACAEAAGHGGVAYALTGLLRALPWHARRGQVYLPVDLLARHGARAEDIRILNATPGVLASLSELRMQARDHLAKARAALSRVDAAAQPAFLPLALVEPYLAQMEKRGYQPFETVIERPQWRRQWTLWSASRRGI